MSTRRAACTLLLLALACGAGPARAQDVVPVPAAAPAETPEKGAGAPTEAGALAAEGRTAAGLGAGVAISGAINPARYRVGPGDLLVLQVRGQLSRTIPLEVDAEGTIYLPGLGVVSVAGQTLTEVRQNVLARLRGQMRNVEMDLRLDRPRAFRVYLTGQVRTPGPVVANGTNRVFDVLNPAVLMEDASHRRIEVLHTDGHRDYCDLELLLATGDATWNPELRDGDVIQVPTASEFINALGAVARPGRYELGVQDSLRTLLRLAGDPLPAAYIDSMLFVRFRGPFQAESLWVSLEDVYSRKIDPPLHDGDRAYVYYMPRYHLQQQAAIEGEVERPGPYPIVEGTTRLSQLVASAGGFLPRADLTSIRVHRRSPLASEKDPELDRLLRLSRNELTASEYEVLNTKLAGLREDYRVDWSRLMRDPNLDLLLRDGDVVRVERLVSSIRVDGQVRRPGIVTYVAGGDVDSYVSAAGGYTDRAWRGKVRVTRAVTGQTLLARNVRALDPGDLIWVPERPDVTNWEQANRILTSLAQIATVVIAIRSLR